ncbi:diphthine methyltransferase homolog [Impatiens glandulifera]|uniref:diphthine methyltransferase homolog n=1 Tax=Impatiens glandulifera TaxID=253017 RepID=UPI001FB14873|nr:diphthine methyltransferase homolog [Impatiens glandulifera]
MDVGHCYLDGNPDAVEFCPHDSFKNVLAVSTYTLQEGDQPSRLGSLSLFNVDACAGLLELSHRVETAGIFDIKWAPVGQVSDEYLPLLAQADANGYLRVHKLESSSYGSSATSEASLRELADEQVSSTSMCLCLDWNPSSNSISVGLSDGSLSIVSFTESMLEIQEMWKAHDFEVWAASFDIHQPQLVYTGSDDCKFSCWDLRAGPSQPAFQNSKIHKMGVCCITKNNPSDPNTLLTGSYDEHLRIWDVRSISKPVNETSVCLGGGVWRLKHNPLEPSYVLAACMHNGFGLVRIDNGGEKIDVVETYGKHESLAYGADWQRGELIVDGKRKNNAVATCSFYDRLLRVWIPECQMFL